MTREQIIAKHAALIQKARDETEQIRSLAFTDALYECAGVKIRMMTPRDFNLLVVARNSFIIGGPASNQVACMLIWTCSTLFPDLSVRDDFLSAIDVENSVEEVRQYISDMFMDAPKGGGGGVPAAASIAHLIHRISSEYGWDDESVINKPLPRLYQYLNLIKMDRNPKAIRFNARVDAANRALMQELNKKA